MKRSDWIALLFVLLIVLLIAIWVYSQDDASETQSAERSSRASFFTRLEKHINQLNKEIENDLNSLRVSREISQSLDRKVSRWLIGFNVMFILVTGVIFYWFLMNDYSVMNAFLATIGILTVICGALSLFCFFKILDPNLILDWLRGRIRSQIYARYKHDPAVIAALEKSIAVKTEIRDTLRDNLNDIS
ncbi:MAG: hypothetical protein JNJ75_17375 [Cyclobacteriaceae bacterium]|nr:hypothetical protein [Cyclobacteriaceae bacterium]